MESRDCHPTTNTFVLVNFNDSVSLIMDFLLFFQGNKPYWVQALEQGKGARNQTGFTTVGKPKMAQKQYNSPMDMYSEEVLDEIRMHGTIG